MVQLSETFPPSLENDINIPGSQEAKKLLSFWFSHLSQGIPGLTFNFAALKGSCGHKLDPKIMLSLLHGQSKPTT
jgi:hypothetical protein